MLSCVLSGFALTPSLQCRDVKPENLLIQPCNDTSWGTQQADSCLHLRLIDFGSAVEHIHAGHMYGPQGPSAAEQTAEYAPPEALLPDR